MDMKTHELANELVENAGGALTVAKLLGNKNKQGTIHRFCKAKTAQPSREIAQELASLFDVPIDSFYDEELADRLLRHLRGMEQLPEKPPPSNVARLVDELANRLDAMSDSQREAAAQKLVTLAQAPDSQRARAALVQALVAIQAKHQAAA